MLYPASPFRSSTSINRRSFLAASTSLAAAALWAPRVEGSMLRRAAFKDHPFQLGVASGDPNSSGVVLWTRLAPKPLEPGGGLSPEPIDVAWEIAEDEAMQRLVKQGTTAATPQLAHSVHVEVDGLRPDRWYWYRFRVGDAESPIGRTRTMPTADATPHEARNAISHFKSQMATL